MFNIVNYYMFIFSVMSIIKFLRSRVLVEKLQIHIVVYVIKLMMTSA